MSQQAKRILSLRRRIEEKFDSNAWMEIGLLTDSTRIIDGHDRLLRSLSWGDSDYSACVLDVLNKIVSKDPRNIDVIEDYLNNGVDVAVEDNYGSSISGRRLIVEPRVFEIPEGEVDRNLVSAMMPFNPAFNKVYDAIVKASHSNGMRADRADNIWEHSTIIQDVFSLIYRSHIVVCDFASKNANVFYEAGIAHTLGRHVIPLAQHNSELPFDLQHHRAIIYQSNAEGISLLEEKLTLRIRTLSKTA